MHAQLSAPLSVTSFLSMVMAYQSVKGTRDIIPPESNAWIHLEQHVRKHMERAGYEEIRTPMFEDTSVFTRGIGEDTDIVGKEMYTFTDKGGSSLTLRPEMTAPVMRAWLQHSLGERSMHSRLYYIGPMFRQERPQAGRYRQFHQFGFESIGLGTPECDTEVIALASDIYTDLGIPHVLKINSVGDPESRVTYRAALQTYLRGVEEHLTAESRRRMETNPMRVLDSKAPQDREVTMEAPHMLDFLGEETRAHFDRVLLLLDALKVSYVIDHRLVRGLDYYSRTAFEFVSDALGAQDALGGGGRYDGLAEQLGGRSTPAVGFAAGIERLLLVLEKQGYAVEQHVPLAFFIGMDDVSRQWAFEQTMAFRRAGMSAACDLAGRSLKATLREANRQQARHVVLAGESEMATQTATVKNMGQGTQESVAFKDLVTYFAHLIQ